MIEIKQSEPSIVPAFAKLLEDRRLQDRVVVASFNDETIQEFRATAPSVRTSYGLAEVIEFIGVTEDTEPDYEPPAQFLQVPIQQLGVDVVTKETVARGKRVNVGMHVWTINDPEEMRLLIDFGVAGIITDDPKTLATTLAE